MNILKKFRVLFLVSIIAIVTVACIPTPTEKEKNETAVTEPAQPKAFGYEVKGSDATYYVYINSEVELTRKFKNTASLNMDMVVVDENTAGTEFISDPAGVSIVGDYIEVKPATAIIFKK